VCLIVYKPDGDSAFTDEHMRSSIDRNDDGAGVMFIDDGRVRVDKIVGDSNLETNQDTLFEWCSNHFNSHDRLLMHHRMTTDGKNCLDNCHPYKVLSKDEDDPIDLYMMHNGVISNCKTGITAELSDSRKYVEEYLRPMLKLNHELIHLEAFHAHMEDFIGSSSKLSFMLDDGRVYIVNEKAGKWQDTGCWISNTYSIGTNTYNHNNGVYIPNTSNVIAWGGDKKKDSTSTRQSNPISVNNQPLVYGNNALAMYEEMEFYHDLYPHWLTMEPDEIVDKLLETGYSLHQIQEVVSVVDQYTLASIMEELLERISVRDYQ